MSRISKHGTGKITGSYILFLFFCLFFNAADCFPETFLVKRVYDGDTVKLQDGRTLRLYGIDAPEMGKQGKKPQYFAVAAQKRLSELVLGRRVQVVKAGDGRDRFGRTLAVLVLPDQRMVNEILLREGVAFYFPHPGKSKTADYHKLFLSAQREAIDSGRGFWPRILSLSASSMVGNRRSRRFHLPSCSYGKSMSRRNRQHLVSLKSAFLNGFAPCRHCSPWPLEGKGGRCFFSEQYTSLTDNRSPFEDHYYWCGTGRFLCRPPSC